MATCSNGLIFDNPKPLKAKTKQLKRWQKRLSRRVKGSQNRKKAQRKVATIHARIANIRSNALHQATAKIVAQKPQAIVLEDLNLKGMVKNHKLARAISDVVDRSFNFCSIRTDKNVCSTGRSDILV